MITDLRSLVNPLSEAEFLTLLRKRELTFLPGWGAHRLETLLNWDTLNQLLDAPIYQRGQLRVVRESISIPTYFYLKQGTIEHSALSNLVKQGVSLIFNRLEEHVPALRTLCKNIARDTSEQIGAAAIVTNGRGGALECHYDPEDLVILQVAGSKRWQVFSPSVVNPVQFEAGRPPQDTPIFDHVLQPGDFLLLPAGYWHHCENGPQRSLHLGILFRPPNGRNLMTELVPQLLSHEMFRRTLTGQGRPEALSADETALKTHLINIIQRISLVDFLTRDAASRQLDGIHLEAPVTCGRDVVASLVRQLTADEIFNRPLTRYADVDALVAHEAALKARLIQQVQAWSLAGFLAERAQRVLEGNPHPIQGQSEPGQGPTVQYGACS